MQKKLKKNVTIDLMAFFCFGLSGAVNLNKKFSETLRIFLKYFKLTNLIKKNLHSHIRLIKHY